MHRLSDMFSLSSRQHGHQQRQPQVDPGSHLVPDRALPAGRVKLPAQEAHARVAQGEDDGLAEPSILRGFSAS